MKLINPSEVRKQAARWWSSGEFLKSELLGEDFFPRDVRFGKLSAQHLQDDFHQVSKDLLSLKNGQGIGYQMELIPTKTRNFGTQYLPQRIWFETKTDFLSCIGKTSAFNSFEKDVNLLRQKLPELSDWVVANPLKIEKYHSSWEEIIKVCRYFLETPKPRLYLRELPIEVHTKFMESHKGILSKLFDEVLPPEAVDNKYAGVTKSNFEKRYGLRFDEGQIRIRFLDPSNTPIRGVADLAIPPDQFKQLPVAGNTIFIVENLMPFLTFPQVKDAIVIFGKGFSVGVLKQIDWLQDKTIYYWGDMDAQGFAILHQVREFYDQVISMFMDEATYRAYESFVVKGTSERPVDLNRLSEAESVLYRTLCDNTLRLEQERIPQKDLICELSKLGLTLL